MNKGKFLYGVWPENRRKSVNTLSGVGITFSVLGFSFGYVAIFMRGYILLACMGIVLAIFGLSFACIARTREFQIYEKCISYPRKIGRTFILYPDILEIKLNTRQEEFVPEIDINLKDGTTLKYSKLQIHDRKEFYRVVSEELKGKVKVVE